MLLGILVALVKISELATVGFPGWACMRWRIYILLPAAIIVSFEPHEIWPRVEWADGIRRRDPSGSAAEPVR